MISKRNIRMVFFFAALLAACFLFVMGVLSDYRHCMNVPFIDEEDLSEYTDDLTIDLENLIFCGQPVAADLANQTIVLSQAQGDLSHYAHLKGELASVQPEQKLYFVRNAAVEELENTVHNGYPLRLAVVEGKRYAMVNVVLTTLPVIRLQGVETDALSEKEHPIIQGTITLFAGYDPASGSISAHSYGAQWNIRGASTAVRYKKPWKLTLKNAKENNREVDLLGLGEDDDWILNPLVMDDTILREKLAMDLWNRNVANRQDGYPMSTGEYVEVVNNGEYVGLYLLQRRVDEKYLNLNRAEDILFKGKNTWVAETLIDGYELIYSPVSEEEAYRALAETLEQRKVSLENYVDVSVFIQFLNALDNRGYKNMFYLLRPVGDGYQLSLIPWDTDFSLGLSYQDGFVYDFEESVQSECYRQEYQSLVELYPQLPTFCEEYWRGYQESMYHLDAIAEMVQKYSDQLLFSGGYKRDIQRWGLVYQGDDTWDALLRWCEERILWLNANKY